MNVNYLNAKPMNELEIAQLLCKVRKTNQEIQELITGKDEALIKKNIKVIFKPMKEKQRLFDIANNEEEFRHSQEVNRHYEAKKQIQQDFPKPPFFKYQIIEENLSKFKYKYLAGEIVMFKLQGNYSDVQIGKVERVSSKYHLLTGDKFDKRRIVCARDVLCLASNINDKLAEIMNKVNMERLKE